MSNLQRFSVHDAKAESYIQPFYSLTVGTALRDFEAAANDPNHAFCKYSEDYTLFHLGEWNHETGKTTDLHTPIPLGKALQFKKQDWNPPQLSPADLSNDTTELTRELRRNNGGHLQPMSLINPNGEEK